MVTKYQKRISGPLLDRIDIHIKVPRVDYEKLSGDRLGETSQPFVQEFVLPEIFKTSASPIQATLSATQICASVR